MFYSSLNKTKLLKEFPFIKDFTILFNDNIDIKKADNELLSGKSVDNSHYNNNDYDFYYLIINSKSIKVGEKQSVLEKIAETTIPDFIVRYYFCDRFQETSGIDRGLVIFKVNPLFIEGELAKALKKAENEVDIEIKNAEG